MQPCPPPERWQSFLSEQLEAAAAAALAQHLEQCRTCREVLDKLSGVSDSKTWRQAREPSPDEAHEPPPAFLRRLEQMLQTTGQDDSLPQPADVLPRPEGYEVLGEVGRGGMGVVYKARHLRLKRTVALKMLRAGTAAGREELARFRVEAEVIAGLQHPNIVQIFDIGEWDGRPFLALEYVEGPSLAERLGGTPLPPRIAAELVEALARAVHYAHQQGVIHGTSNRPTCCFRLAAARRAEWDPPRSPSGR
jgi:serine/threonine protein kinase